MHKTATHSYLAPVCNCPGVTNSQADSQGESLQLPLKPGVVVLAGFIHFTQLMKYLRIEPCGCQKLQKKRSLDFPWVGELSGAQLEGLLPSAIFI